MKQPLRPQKGQLGKFSWSTSRSTVQHAARGEMPTARPVDRLEDKGLISSWLSDPTPERGGRSKRYYRLETDGERALRDSVLTARRICAAAEEAWGDAPWTGK